MRPTSSGISLYISILSLAPLAVPAPGAAQLLDLRTVPLAAGDQFFIAPARNTGMAGPALALDDPLLDPFVNPAKGSRLLESQLFASPTAYSISDRGGGARTLPIGMLLTSGPWFGGGVAALQQIVVEDPGPRYWIPLLEPNTNYVLPSNTLLDRRPENKYAQVFLGRRLGSSGLAVAGSARLADLNGTDGVENLFANAWDIVEFGHVQDYRLGVVGTLAGDRTFEAVLLHNRVDLTQDVTTVQWTLTDTVYGFWTPDVRHESHLDETRTWGAHVGYAQPLGESDWRIGGALTANRKEHPKIPTYDLVNEQFSLMAPIPRDPGESWAYSIGVGVSRVVGPTTFGMDVAYEPAVSDTWGDAAADTVLADGTTLLAGGHTVDNHFVFSNARLNIGATHEIGRGAIQLGFRAHHVDYRLHQDDHLTATQRTQTEQWTEWTPTWGFRFTWTSVELRYTGWASSASHFPSPHGQSDLLEVAASGTDVLAAPTGRLIIPEQTTVTHRLAVSVPLR